jgi:hypothetical protein
VRLKGKRRKLHQHVTTPTKLRTSRRSVHVERKRETMKELKFSAVKPTGIRQLAKSRS